MNTTETYVGFWKRTWATVIDTVFLCVVIFPPLIAIYGSSYFDPEVTGFVAGPADFIISWVLPFFVWIAFWSWKQATPGKMAIKSKIVDSKTGGKPTIWQWILRYLGYYVSLIPLGIGYFWVAFDRRKQGWHDKMAGTVVVPDTR